MYMDDINYIFKNLHVCVCVCVCVYGCMHVSVVTGNMSVNQLFEDFHLGRINRLHLQ